MRLMAMATIYSVMLLRALPLYKREASALLALEAALAAALGPAAALPLSLAAAAAVLLLLAWGEPEVNLGHRAGAEGFDGPHLENTIDALLALLSCDNGPGGPLRDLRYIEFDVRETADGRVVVLHDDVITVRSFPPRGPNIAPLIALGLLAPDTQAPANTTQLQEQAKEPQQPQQPPPPQQQQQQQPSQHQQQRRQSAPSPPGTVSALTLSQLRSLSLGAREGQVAPTLSEFMTALRGAGCLRTVAVEVKGLRSDAGRRELVDEMRAHRQYAETLAARHPELLHPGLGPMAVIAFPNHYADSFGELGTEQCTRWTRELAAAGARVRCCVFWQLDYARGLRRIMLHR